MSLANIVKIVRESRARWIQLSGIGETFLHPNIIDIMAAIKSQDKLVKITTNGTSLTEEICRGIVDTGIDYIDVSIDTTDAELYRTIRGTDLKNVIQKVQYLSDYRNAAKSKLIIAAKHVYNAKNIDNISHDIERLVRLPFDEASFLWILDAYEGSHSSTISGEYLEIIHEAIQMARKLKRPDLARTLQILLEQYHLLTGPIAGKICFEPVYAPYVTVDGDLTACCKSSMWILQDEKNLRAFRMGNVIEKPFHEVWNSEDAIMIRRNVLENRTHFAMCQHCQFDQHQFFKHLYKFSSTCIYR
jgi:MoaA/NifB/PqqE/SkfB family radical SAM enzyme